MHVMSVIGDAIVTLPNSFMYDSFCVCVYILSEERRKNHHNGDHVSVTKHLLPHRHLSHCPTQLRHYLEPSQGGSPCHNHDLNHHKIPLDESQRLGDQHSSHHFSFYWYQWYCLAILTLAVKRRHLFDDLMMRFENAPPLFYDNT